MSESDQGEQAEQRVEPETSKRLSSYPPYERWDDWVEYDAKSWPTKVERRYSLVPTTCFNCEAACGLLAYVDKENGVIKKFEGNPLHPGSRGRNCAKDRRHSPDPRPERILYPPSGCATRRRHWHRTTWDECSTHSQAEDRPALIDNRRDEIVYPLESGHDGYMDRVLQAWGVDGHNSHTKHLLFFGESRLALAGG